MATQRVKTEVLLEVPGKVTITRRWVGKRKRSFSGRKRNRKGGK